MFSLAAAPGQGDIHGLWVFFPQLAAALDIGEKKSNGTGRKQQRLLYMCLNDIVRYRSISFSMVT